VDFGDPFFHLVIAVVDATVPTRSGVMDLVPDVLPPRNNPQIAESVVSADPVDVVNVHASGDAPAMGLYDQAMNKNRSRLAIAAQRHDVIALAVQNW
jgi:hypothetical protein